MVSNKEFITIGGTLLAAAFALNALYVFGTPDTATFTVKSKERITETSGSGNDIRVSSKYLVYSNSETFENSDSYLKLKFNSSDLYGQLDAGSSYTCEVYGWRIPILSSYRNIVSCVRNRAAPQVNIPQLD